MARDESQREDLLGEATALVERIEFKTAEPCESIVAGFRADGAFSIFFGEDPVYHFNAGGELRRAYCNGLLIKASSGRLVSLRRERTTTETQLIRRELDEFEQSAFTASLQSRLNSLRMQVASDRCTVIRQVPDEKDVLARVADWLSENHEHQIAQRANL